MWNRLAHSVLKHRLFWLLGILVITGFMGYHAQKVQMSFEFGGVVPKTDPDMIFFENAKKRFGEDGNLLAIAIKDSSIYKLDQFKKFKTLSDELAKVNGVNEVLSLPRTVKVYKNTEEKKFEIQSIFQKFPTSQRALDSLLQIALNQKLYANQLVNDKNGATAVLVSINKKVLDSKMRFTLMDNIQKAGDQFTKDTGIKLHFAGLPFIRATVSKSISNELKMFLVLSLLVTAFILWVFFRSWDAVAVPMILIVIIVIWSMGTLGLLGYKITLLTGLIPPIIVVIGIPNSVYLLNKYHQEIAKHGNKARALSVVIRKIGMVTLITNFTTAAGFVVLAFTSITLLKEFGIVAGINILGTFFVSIILIPALFSYLPTPHGKRLKHLEFTGLTSALNWLDLIVHRHPYRIFATAFVVIVISAIGVTKLQAISYMVDDIPEDSQIKKDLHFFEENFGGVMPLQFIVDTGKPRGAQRLSNLKRIDKFQQFLDSQRVISEPISLVSAIKAANQAYYNGKPKYYKLPRSNSAFTHLGKYLEGQDNEQNKNLLKSLVDSTGRYLRINCMVADIGSKNLGILLNETIQPEIDRLFGNGKVTVKPTGTTLLFVKGNNFLIGNLITSMIMAFCIIAFIMALLFRKVRIILISLIPNMIPLLMTAGLMGYFDIALKPSTALIFSITFGIAVDDSIHFLAKYRQELFANKFFVPLAITKSIKETGSSMIYTSIVLFFGFVIFTFSEFGGTKALGLLTSITLLMAMLTNLVVLPALLLVFDPGKRVKGDAWAEHIEEFYHEEEDEEINLDQIKIEDKKKKKE